MYLQPIEIFFPLQSITAFKALSKRLEKIVQISYADKSQNSESKKAELDSQLRELYIRTKNLVTRVSEEQSMGSSKKL